MITIEIDLDKKCIRCKKGGATQSGLCMTCITKALKHGEYDPVINSIKKYIKEILASSDSTKEKNQ